MAPNASLDPTISLEDVNVLHLKDFARRKVETVHFLTPTEGITEAEVSALLESAEQIEDVAYYTESVSTATLLPTPLPSAILISEQNWPGVLRFVRWIFENGVEVWLKQTDFDENINRWGRSE